MGVQIRELVEPVRRELKLEELRGKTIAIDAMNALYQFVTIIRQPDGTPLKDSKGRITSHLSGLFYRTVNLYEYGIKPVYVFDGRPPELKSKTVEERKKAREEAGKLWIEALERGDLEEAAKYAKLSGRVTPEMVEDAKELLRRMGVPFVQAPSEGEAQAAYMASRGDVWASASQDYDSLLFGSPRLVRYLAITGRRKVPGKNVYQEVPPELIELEKVLKQNDLTREQLIDLAILLGTDYNEGPRGVGIKTAYNLIKRYGSLERLLELGKFKIEDFGGVDPLEVKKIFLEPEVTDDYKLSWRPPDEEAVVEFLVEEHDFSEDRVRRALERLRTAYQETHTQRTLEAWF